MILLARVSQCAGTQKKLTLLENFLDGQTRKSLLLAKLNTVENSDAILKSWILLFI
jgi:hypothetical protein